MGASGDARARAARYGWGPLVALAATVALEAGERQSLAQAVDGIKDEFGVSDLAVGALPFAMALVGVAGGFPMGALADRVRRTALLAGAMAIWTACMGLNVVAPTFALLVVARLGVGAVEATGPASISLLADYYPVRDRARMIGLYQAGALFGVVVGLVGGGVAVSAGSWRWAFALWIPLGVLGAVALLRQPEPARGHQDADFEADLAAATPEGGAVALEHAEVFARLLPDPVRTPTLDYESCTTRDVYRELLRIPSMWFGVLALTVSQLLLNGVQFWGVEFFKREFDLDAAAAGALVGLIGFGAIIGILGGGVLSDRLLRRGDVNARPHVVAWGSIAATVALVPAFASPTLLLTCPLLLLGGILLTLPLAPAEAMTQDVVVAELRGRAAAIRAAVRALSHAGPLVIGALSEVVGLRAALVLFSPLYAAGGALMLLATRHYPRDVAFVVAEARRRREASGATG